MTPGDAAAERTIGYTIVTGVFAVEASAARNWDEIYRLWSNRPDESIYPKV